MNTELARLVLKQIENDPALFDMREWGIQTPCGTVACIAGHTLLASGYGFAPSSGLGSRGFFVHPVSGEAVSPRYEARDLLGLSHDEAGRLFFIYDNAAAIARFRELIEQSETAE